MGQCAWMRMVFHHEGTKLTKQVAVHTGGPCLGGQHYTVFRREGNASSPSNEPPSPWRATISAAKSILRRQPSMPRKYTSPA
jgi:hypothetical protein